jgi:hypothetical protein
MSTEATTALGILLRADTILGIHADAETRERATSVLRTLEGPSKTTHMKCSFVEEELLEPVEHGTWSTSFRQGLPT